MIGNRIGHRLDPYIDFILRKLHGKRGNPNVYTFLGFFSTLAASILVLKQLWFPAGLAIILSGLFDLFDGVVARELGKVTIFGGFLDSVLDRYSDLIFLSALVLHYAERGDTILVAVASAVIIGTALIPYARARAEAAGIPCTIGFMERAERIILLSVGILFDCMRPILWILALLTQFTVLQRIWFVWKTLRKRENQQKAVISAEAGIQERRVEPGMRRQR
jgi:CDP-diacylglycerol---glycerol-3-phosphate 3-phosphatidyltransferase